MRGAPLRIDRIDRNDCNELKEALAAFRQWLEGEIKWWHADITTARSTEHWYECLGRYREAQDALAEFDRRFPQEPRP